MRKIPTLFERGPDGLVTPDRNPRAAWLWEIVDAFRDLDLEGIDCGDHFVTATEKIDGTNVRLTVRAGEVMRVEARRNPTKDQKAAGIVDPWYREVRLEDASPSDKWIAAAVSGTDVSDWPDGEHCAEAVGPKIQGNPYGLDSHECHPFDLFPEEYDLTLRDYTFEQLRLTTRTLASKFRAGVPAEGIVFHGPDGERAKIKRSDFWR